VKLLYVQLAMFSVWLISFTVFTKLFQARPRASKTLRWRRAVLLRSDAVTSEHAVRRVAGCRFQFRPGGVSAPELRDAERICSAPG